MIRRRQMSHSFSTATLMRFEAKFNTHLDRLYANVEKTNGNPFDIKELFACYAYDVISDLAFDKDFRTQSDPTTEALPSIADHILIGVMYGMVSWLMPYSIRIGNKLPFPSLQKLIRSRRELSQRAAQYVGAAIESHKGGSKETLLDNLLEAKDPETGASLTPTEISSEAFSFLYVMLYPLFNSYY